MAGSVCGRLVQRPSALLHGTSPRCRAAVESSREPRHTPAGLRKLRVGLAQRQNELHWGYRLRGAREALEQVASGHSQAVVAVTSGAANHARASRSAGGVADQAVVGVVWGEAEGWWVGQGGRAALGAGACWAVHSSSTQTCSSSIILHALHTAQRCTTVRVCSQKVSSSAPVAQLGHSV